MVLSLIVHYRQSPNWCNEIKCKCCNEIRIFQHKMPSKCCCDGPPVNYNLIYAKTLNCSLSFHIEILESTTPGQSYIYYTITCIQHMNLYSFITQVFK